MSPRKKQRSLRQELLGIGALLIVGLTAPVTVPAVFEISQNVVAPYIVGLMTSSHP